MIRLRVAVKTYWFLKLRFSVVAGCCCRAPSETYWFSTMAIRWILVDGFNLRPLARAGKNFSHRPRLAWGLDQFGLDAERSQERSRVLFDGPAHGQPQGAILRRVSR